MKQDLERRCAAQANALADKLTKAGENFVAGLFFTAGYDPPFRLTGALRVLPPCTCIGTFILGPVAATAQPALRMR